MDDKERKELFAQVKSKLYEILQELKVSYTSLLYVSCFTFDSARSFYFDKKSKAPHPQQRIELIIKYFNIQTIDSDYHNRLLIVDELFKLCFE